MASLSIKISIVEKDLVKTMQFDPNTTVFDVCRQIRDRIPEVNLGVIGQRESLLLLLLLLLLLICVVSWARGQLKITASSWPMRIPRKGSGWNRVAIWDTTCCAPG